MFRRVWNQTHHFFRIVVTIAAVLAAFCFVACVKDDVNRGNEALRIGDFDRAVKNFSKALDAEPANRDARYGLALAYYSIAEENEHMKVSVLEAWQRTVSEFRILSRLDSSGRIDAAYSTSLFYLARATLAANRYAEVLPLLDKSIVLDSVNYFSYNLKALVLESQGRSEEAKKIFVYILTKDSKFASAYLNLGNIYWNAGDVESAWDIWSMGHEALPKNTDLSHWTQVAEDSLKALVSAGEL